MFILFIVIVVQARFIAPMRPQDGGETYVY